MTHVEAVVLALELADVEADASVEPVPVVVDVELASTTVNCPDSAYMSLIFPGFTNWIVNPALQRTRQHHTDPAEL